MLVYPGASVDHLPKRIDHVTDRAWLACSHTDVIVEKSELVDRDDDDVDACSFCESVLDESEPAIDD